MSSKKPLLENPYIAAKLAKLQSALMDHLHKESLKAEGKERERVQVTPRKPGPRTEEEKRKFYRARRLRPKAASQPEFVTLAQARDKLGYDSEKSVRRLKKSGELEAKHRVHDGKRRLMIRRVDLNRSVILADRWFQTQFGPVPTLHGQGDFGVVFVYGPWQKKASARLPRYTLNVTIEEFWQFACKPYESKSHYESIKTALRKKVRGAAEDFQVRYVFDERALATLKRIIRFVWDDRRLDDIQGFTKSELINDALSHLQLKVLPKLWRAERGWAAYLCQGVSNFFKDQVRKIKRLNIPRSQLTADQALSEQADLADQDLLSEADFQNWKKSKDWGKINQAELNDTPLSQWAYQNLQASDVTELCKRLDPEQFLIFTEHLRKLREGNKPTKRAANRRR